MGPRIRELAPADRNDVADALVRCGAFTAEEIAVALELFDAGSSAGYWLFGAEVNGRIAGYVCIGTATLTESSWYVYWLCVHPDAQRRGIARALQDRAEQFVWSHGGRRLVVETSGRGDYDPAHQFYQRAGYVKAGVLEDFYRSGDDCVIYVKQLHRDEQASRLATQA
jgi:ribosomal protein S18 acetylase RimI-like enzyme